MTDTTSDRLTQRYWLTKKGRDYVHEHVQEKVPAGDFSPVLRKQGKVAQAVDTPSSKDA